MPSRPRRGRRDLPHQGNLFPAQETSFLQLLLLLGPLLHDLLCNLVDYVHTLRLAALGGLDLFAGHRRALSVGNLQVQGYLGTPTKNPAGPMEARFTWLPGLNAVVESRMVYWEHSPRSSVTPSRWTTFPVACRKRSMMCS